MAFSKTFPKKSDKSAYPNWIEIYLTEEEERAAEEECRAENNKAMRECIEDARMIVQEKRLLESQGVLTRIAVALFEKRGSHEVFFKEKKAKEKFDSENL
jgi:hypothetical protein